MSEHRSIKFVHLGEEFTLYLHPEGEGVSDAIVRESSFFESDVLGYIRDRFNEHHTIVEVGANIGNHAVFFHEFLCFKKLICFEPLRKNFELLRLNTIERGNISIHQMAIGNSVGVCSMVADPTNMGGSRIGSVGSGNILYTTLDSFNLNNVSMIKIDVEGHEKEVFEGSLETIKRNRPVLVFEDARDEWILPLGYRVDKKFSRVTIYCWNQV